MCHYPQILKKVAIIATIGDLINVVGVVSIRILTTGELLTGTLRNDSECERFGSVRGLVQLREALFLPL